MSEHDTTSRPVKVSGQQAEDLAARFLARRGLSILARNYRCRGGEIDLICHDGRSLVFVEVRLRRNLRFGGAAASITAAKRRRIVLAAQHYLNAKTDGSCDCRFDCVLLEQLSIDHIEWLRDAFSAD